MGGLKALKNQLPGNPIQSGPGNSGRILTCERVSIDPGLLVVQEHPMLSGAGNLGRIFTCDSLERHGVTRRPGASDAKRHREFGSHIHA